MKTKQILLSLFLSVATTLSAQTILKGDMNDDNAVTISDVTSLVNVILGKSPIETIDLSMNPYEVDNKDVVGTWYMPDGTSFTFREDGTTDFPKGATYEFMPQQGRLLVYDAKGRPVKILPLAKIAPEYLLTVNYATGTFAYYTNQSVLVASFTISPIQLNMEFGETAQLLATTAPETAFNPTIAWTSSDESVALVDEDGLVKAIRGGTCTITASTTDGSALVATCEITIHKDESGTIGGRDYIDLNLPSGTLWATMNVGASTPEDYGDYFAWGETTGYKSGKTTFTWTTYAHCQGSNNTLTKYCFKSTDVYGTIDNLTELEEIDDAAYVNWDSNWRTPTLAQLIELFDSRELTIEWTTQNGVYGRKFTCKTNGNSIFLPAAGFINGTSLNGVGSNGNYWSRTLNTSYIPTQAIRQFFHSGGMSRGSLERCYGQSVRPVLNINE